MRKTLPRLSFEKHLNEIFSAFVFDLVDPVEELKPLYRNLLFLLATSDVLSKNSLSISTELISSLLVFGLTAEEYEDVVDQAQYLFENHGALNNLDWVLDVLEVLVLDRCQDQEARLRFFTAVTAFAQQSLHRLSKSQKYALEALHRDFSIALPPEFGVEDALNQEEGEQDISHRLSGKKIGIYTLTHSAGKRAVDALLKGNYILDRTPSTPILGSRR